MSILEFIFKVLFYYILMLLDVLRYRWFGTQKSCPDDEEDVSGEVVVITGGNRGIGKACAMELATRNAIVVIGCKDMKKGLETVKEIKEVTGNGFIEAIHLDLSDMDAVEKFAIEVAIKYPRIRILINNAGLAGATEPWAQQKTKEGFNIHVAVNHLGHFLLTNLLLENIKKAGAARIVAVSSTFHFFSNLDLDDLMMDKSGFGYLKTLPYANTKFANALFIKELGDRLNGSNVRTYALCPTMVKTEIHDSGYSPRLLELIMKYQIKYFAFTPEEAASESVMFCSLDKAIAKESGLMYRLKKQLHHANIGLNAEIRMKLWDISAKLVHLDERLQRINTARAKLLKVR